MELFDAEVTDLPNGPCRALQPSTVCRALPRRSLGRTLRGAVPKGAGTAILLAVTSGWANPVDAWSAPSQDADTGAASTKTGPAPRPGHPRAELQKAVPRATCPSLDVHFAAGVARRDFDYEREHRGALRRYTLAYAPLVGVGATWFPLAHTGCGARAGFGVSGGYEQIFGASSQLAGRQLETHASAGRSELLVRIPTGRLWFTPRVGYHFRRFRVGGSAVPDVDYHTARLGLDAGTRLGLFELELSGGGRLLRSFGELGSSAWFPNVEGFAYDAAARVGVALTDVLSAFGEGRIEMTRLTLNARAEARNGIADGAYDRAASASFGVRLELPGRRR